MRLEEGGRRWLRKDALVRYVKRSASFTPYTMQESISELWPAPLLLQSWHTALMRWVLATPHYTVCELQRAWMKRPHSQHSSSDKRALACFGRPKGDIHTCGAQTALAICGAIDDRPSRLEIPIVRRWRSATSFVRCFVSKSPGFASPGILNNLKSL